MNFIKVEEQEKYVEDKGLKLFYINTNKAKEYESHINVLKALIEDYDTIKIYVVNKENISRCEFLFYEDNNLIKSFVNSHLGSMTAFLRKYITSNNNNEEKYSEKRIIEKIENLLKNNKIILFMKGNKHFPQCKFSNAVIFILNSLKIRYETYDILQDEEIRNQLKIYSNWPTYPQLYINSELIGGHDIIKSMFENDELKSLIPEDCFEH
ncbi:glutaredoxin-like protein, putative [Plasmodium gallinaceum]|uniref:Glutaredoxin-like protein, putative n=1 Tax=Plasmodium gallinaceum TaxID=5849 RepID=A0A1J1GML6_PLAGA|nr:glutaredoxin-like protein, putative [Plasmodium gallinaceum]CRG93649.1 glutaredoxin-like protein, putative [Plasmodium gallinaceum]